MSEASDPPKGPTEDMVRRLLQLNPHLRGDGKSTKDVMSTLQAHTAPAAPLRPEPPKATASIATSVEIQNLRVKHDARAAQLRKEQSDWKAKANALQAQRKAAHEQACARVIDAILRLDPDLLQRGSQLVLEQRHAFLSQIGYSSAKLLAEEKRRRGGR